jgi:RNA polymerase sigma factor (sigma-70 family)
VSAAVREEAENDVEPEDAGDRVRAGLEKLPPDQCTILTLFYLEDMSIAEIAASLVIPGGTVKSRLFQARNHLKAILLKSNH